MQEKLQTENKMGVMPVNKLLLSMAVPMIISMLVQALYNVVDSIFVSRISENALTAVSLAFPMQNLLISFAVGFGVGINALMSRALGEKDPAHASRIAISGMVLEAASYVIFLILGLFFTETFMRAQISGEVPAEDAAEIISHGVSYLRIVLIFSFGVFIEITYERILQSTGRTTLSMITQLIGAILNIIFDPILIFGLLGFPEMGIAGAAVATVGGQIVAAIVAFFINKHWNREITLAGARPSKVSMLAISRISIPSIVMSSISSVTTFFMNLILTTFTATAAAVFGVYFKLQSFVFMPVFGVTNALVPIVGYNYGARSSQRIQQATRLSLLMTTAIMALGTVIFQVAPGPLLSQFSASDTMLSIGIPALRIISVSFCFAGVAIVFSSVFQALGDGMLSLVMSAVRQLLLLLPCAFVLAKLGGLDAVWFSFLIAEVASVTLAVVFYRSLYNKKIRHI